MNVTRLIHIFILIFALYSFESIDQKTSNIFVVNKRIKTNPIFKKLNMEREIQMGIDLQPPKSKRTTNIIYDDFSELICEAKFNKSEPILISIYHNSGLNTMGFDIEVLEKQFKVNPFFSSDVHGTQRFHGIKIKKQILILDKCKYKKGDSIFGYIDFEINELYEDEDSYRPSYGKGFFRTKIK